MKKSYVGHHNGGVTEVWEDGDRICWGKGWSARRECFEGCLFSSREEAAQYSCSKAKSWIDELAANIKKLRTEFPYIKID